MYCLRYIKEPFLIMFLEFYNEKFIRFCFDTSTALLFYSRDDALKCIDNISDLFSDDFSSSFEIKKVGE